MAKKVVKLTEGKLAKVIKDLTLEYLNEMDGATYSRVYNASHNAKKEIQSGTLQHTYGKKIVKNDDIVTRASKLEPEVQQHWLKDYVSQTFKFFGEDRLGLIADILFTFDKITKLNETRTILVGYVIYNDIEINGDGIIVNTQTGVVKYKDKKSSYEYTLEVDIRSKMKWNELLEQIKIALANQQK